MPKRTIIERVIMESSVVKHLGYEAFLVNLQTVAVKRIKFFPCVGKMSCCFARLPHCLVIRCNK